MCPDPQESSFDACRRRLPIVGVMGSGEHAHEDLAAPLGRWLATQPVHLLTGGGRGTMEAVGRAFYHTPGRQGLSIGILPHCDHPNPWVEIAILTHLPLSGIHGTEPLSRNHINVLTAAAIVALPGAAGTASEVTLARRYHRPVIAYLRERSDIPGLPDDVAATSNLEEVKRFVQRHVENL
ncbi:MAG: molybdenum cofactor carrier protein [Candidatus Eisenbacteria bacterium]